MRKLLDCAKGNKLTVIALLLLAIITPINHIFYHDNPNSPLQKLETFILNGILGLNITEQDWQYLKSDSTDEDDEDY